MGNSLIGDAIEIRNRPNVRIYIIHTLMIYCKLFSFLDGIQKTYYNAHEILFKYKIQALQGLLKAGKIIKKAKNDATTERQKKIQNQTNTVEISKSEPKNIASELTLIMLFPLIESVSKSDLELCSKITKLLIEYFKHIPPMSVKGSFSYFVNFEYCANFFYLLSKFITQMNIQIKTRSWISKYK